MAVTLGTLLVKLEAHTSGFSKGMTDMRNLSFRSAKDISNSLGLINKALRGLDFSTPAGSAKAFGAIGTVVGAGIGAIASAAVAAGVATTKMALDAAEAADKLNNMAQKAGVSVEFLSRLQYAAKLADTDIGALVSGVQKMERKMYDAATGSKEAAEGFNALKVSVQDANGQLRDPEKVFTEVTNKLSSIENTALRGAIAQKIFGKSGADLIPVMNQLGGSFEEVFKEADRLGLTMSTSTAQSADRLTDNIEKLKASMTGFSNQVLAGSVESLEELSKFLLEFITKSESARVTADFLADGLKFMASAAVIAASRFADLINSIQTMNRIQANLQFGNFNLDEVKKALADYNRVLEETEKREMRTLARINKEKTPADIFFSDVKSGSSDVKTGKVNIPTPPPTAKGALGSREYDRSLQEAVTLLGQIRERALGIVDPSAKVGAEWDQNVGKLQALAVKFPSLRNEINSVIELSKNAKLIEVNKEDLELLEDANKAVQDYAKTLESIPQFIAPTIAVPELKTDIFGARLQQIREMYGDAAKGTEEFGRAQTDAFNMALSAEQRYQLELEKINLLLDDSVDGERARAKITAQLQQERIRGIEEELMATRNFADGAKAAFLEYVDAAKDAAANAFTAFSNSFRSIEDALTDLISGEKVNFKDLESSILKEFNRNLVIKPLLGNITQTIGGAIFGKDAFKALQKPDLTQGNPGHVIVENFGGLDIGGPDFAGINDAFDQTALEISTEWGGVINNTDTGFQNMIKNTDSGFSGLISKIGNLFGSIFSGGGGGSTGGSGLLGSIIGGIGGLFGGSASPVFSFSGGAESLAGSGLDGFTGSGGGWDLLGLEQFAKGGVSHKPAIFGEAGPEAAVPLPDGRRIPVEIRQKDGGESERPQFSDFAKIAAMVVGTMGAVGAASSPAMAQQGGTPQYSPVAQLIERVVERSNNNALNNLPMFADGGVTNRPAIFGEAGAEAAVPLPDGRNIPVKLSGENRTPEKVEIHQHFVNPDKNTNFRVAGSQAAAGFYAEASRQHARNGRK